MSAGSVGVATTKVDRIGNGRTARRFGRVVFLRAPEPSAHAASVAGVVIAVSGTPLALSAGVKSKLPVP